MTADRSQDNTPASLLTYEAMHRAGLHDDRKGASTKYVEVCWRCAENFIRYWRAHPDSFEMKRPIVLAQRPKGGAA